MSDDEDYMSDAFLQKISDTRPGLVPKHVARVHQQQKKEKVANEKNKQKPRSVLEQEKRTEGLGAAISSHNKGFAMLQKMGYKPGMAIGKKGEGRTEPVPVEVKLGRGGLGRETDQKRKQEHRLNTLKNMAAKKQKMDVKMKETFMKNLNEKFVNRNVERDLYKSQKVCEQLDSQIGLTCPHEVFFWPEALLPKPDDEEGGVSDEPLDPLEEGYTGYVQDSEEEDGDEAKNEGAKEKPVAAFSVDEKLEVLTLYLRTKHKYCVWCGTKYEDKEDLASNCPGNTAELHED